MLLHAPGHIPVERWRQIQPTYAWSDWNPYELVGEADPIAEHELHALADRAALAYALGCAEWVVFRLSGFMQDPQAEMFLQAAWAFEMSPTFAAPPESDEAQWKGPVRGVVDLALMTVLNAIYSLPEHASHIDAAFLERLALHVVPDREPFLCWRSVIIPRLATLYPRGQETSFPYVPRELLDSSLAATNPNETRTLVKRFLESLDPTENPMLEQVDQ